MTPGTKLGPYEILSPIGAGGMGEVYRARDTNLGRDVAIKVLPDAFARDADRMARFGREAKLLASLNHSNIASIYGLETSGNSRALVMELAEGPTLADRIAQGPLLLDDVLKIAKQIAEALEYAHEKGIIHRDLKPANIKVAADDTVKILDFGLAKALESDTASIDISTSPTISRMATMQGVLLGTAAYMSPEQAKAKPVDRRADIWAFGCVLYEMLTGKMAFTGETVTDTLAAVIRAEPNWSQLPANTPSRLRTLLQRCLQKDPKQRLQAIGDARISIDEVLAGAPEPSSSTVAGVPISQRANRHKIILWSSTAALIAAVIAGLLVWILKPTPPLPVTRAVITLPPGQQLAGFDNLVLALSPDGSQLAYVATAQGQGGETQQIYLRKMDSLDASPVPGTEGAIDPFFSPDGQWLGFFADGKLKKISVSGGPAQILADDATPLGASWNNRGMIAFSGVVTPIYQIPDSGGTPQALTHPENGEIGHGWPEFLPGGKAVLFAARGIAAQPIGAGRRRNLTPGGISPRYLSSRYLIYAQGGDLMAVQFDPQRLELKGTSVPVVQNVMQEPAPVAPAQYSVSATGSLVYVSGSAQTSQSTLVWVSRNGTEQPLPAPARDYEEPRLSPDGRRVALDIGGQIWIYDLARDTLTRLTFGGGLNIFPTWTPDGKRIAFSSNRGGTLNLYWQMADGSGGLERLTTSEHPQFPLSWSHNGELLSFQEVYSEGAIWVLRLNDRKAQPFLQAAAYEGAPQFSPDGRWMVYASNESGRNEVYVQPYPGPGGKYQISTDGGSEPVWNRNGRELFYCNGDKMMAVEITTEPSFSADKPKMLFEGGYVGTNLTFPEFDVSPDGQRFLMLKPVTQAQAAPTRIDVVLNWAEELKRLVPTGK